MEADLQDDQVVPISEIDEAVLLSNAPRQGPEHVAKCQAVPMHGPPAIRSQG